MAGIRFLASLWVELRIVVWIAWVASCSCRQETPQAPLAVPPATSQQDYLPPFGYFQVYGESTSVAKIGRRDVPTQKTVDQVQSSQYIRLTEELNEQALRESEEPRCGVSDFDRPHFLKSRPRRPLRWAQNSLTFSVAPDTPSWVLEVARQAILDWQSHTSLSFEWVDAFNTADIQISFKPDHHDDQWALRPPTVAHAFPPGTILPGQVHFRAAANWGMVATTKSLDLRTYMIHEIGHAMGLSHSSDRHSIMNEHPRNGQRELSPRDVATIRALYPKP
ncbi:matrixin family metalloprotease [Pyxidicoccus sp. MSG2]|uniref:matrixin family metalloprotease n=1 Tax=Pyxidicoccus sp. MSG2 TaxID=2996790 RepID=UPI003B637FA8